ncbi:maleate cis-trans isomerase family protein [Nocardioides humi]|uniref:Aspartate/glutamate racemase family protein n=1 Tax=Nocardioides humi TaxID=449461 RepID=A0ABN2BDT0_9ACTN|nr:aspartate/glutamate racemase family protein [Nocardioides humi]
MGIGFGTAARVGHLYPSGGLCDYEVQLMAPSGVQFLTTRMPFRRTGVADDLALAEGLEAHAALLADAAVDLIAFNCTAASMLLGPARVNERITAATGIPSVTTIEAVLEALAHLGAHRLVLLDPYPQEVEEAEVAHLAAAGHEVVARGGPECATPVEQGCLTPEEWRRIARAADARRADAVLISCAGAQVAASIAEIEDALGIPVVASNQALLWKVLRMLDLPAPVPGYGRLLSEES